MTEKNHTEKKTLKSSITKEVKIEVENDDDKQLPEKVEGVYVPVVRKVVRCEVERPTRNAQLYNIEALINSSLALLLARKEQEGELSKTDWKRLQDMVSMLEKIEKLGLLQAQKNVLEGKSIEQVIELVEDAKATLQGNKDE